jgi:NTP pyrophosphatase (non-canonical NTP hydrolase)
MDINELVQRVDDFRIARDWKQFHSPSHLAAAISIEAAELQEEFLWKSPNEVQSKISDPVQKVAVEEELADVLILALLLAKEIGSDPAQIILKKLEKNAVKYPVEKARGSSKKYTNL